MKKLGVNPNTVSGRDGAGADTSDRSDCAGLAIRLKFLRIKLLFTKSIPLCFLASAVPYPKCEKKGTMLMRSLLKLSSRTSLLAGKKYARTARKTKEEI